MIVCFDSGRLVWNAMNIVTFLLYQGCLVTGVSVSPFLFLVAAVVLNLVRNDGEWVGGCQCMVYHTFTITPHITYHTLHTTHHTHHMTHNKPMVPILCQTSTNHTVQVQVCHWNVHFYSSPFFHFLPFLSSLLYYTCPILYFLSQ